MLVDLALVVMVLIVVGQRGLLEVLLPQREKLFLRVNIHLPKHSEWLKQSLDDRLQPIQKKHWLITKLNSISMVLLILMQTMLKKCRRITDVQIIIEQTLLLLYMSQLVGWLRNFTKKSLLNQHKKTKRT